MLTLKNGVCRSAKKAVDVWLMYYGGVEDTNQKKVMRGGSQPLEVREAGANTKVYSLRAQNLYKKVRSMISRSKGQTSTQNVELKVSTKVHHKCLTICGLQLDKATKYSVFIKVKIPNTHRAGINM